MHTGLTECEKPGPRRPLAGQVAAPAPCQPQMKEREPASDHAPPTREAAKLFAGAGAGLGRLRGILARRVGTTLVAFFDLDVVRVRTGWLGRLNARRWRRPVPASGIKRRRRPRHLRRAPAPRHRPR